MPESTLYTVIPVVYFAALTGLGLRFNRHNRSRREYYLARGDLGPATLGFPYSATRMSGSSYMGAVGTERELGYNFAPAGVSSAAAAWFTLRHPGRAAAPPGVAGPPHDDRGRLRGALPGPGGEHDRHPAHAPGIRPADRGPAQGGGGWRGWWWAR